MKLRIRATAIKLLEMLLFMKIIFIKDKIKFLYIHILI